MRKLLLESWLWLKITSELVKIILWAFLSGLINIRRATTYFNFVVSVLNEAQSNILEEYRATAGCNENDTVLRYLRQVQTYSTLDYQQVAFSTNADFLSIRANTTRFTQVNYISIKQKRNKNPRERVTNWFSGFSSEIRRNIRAKPIHMCGALAEEFEQQEFSANMLLSAFRNFEEPEKYTPSPVFEDLTAEFANKRSKQRAKQSTLALATNSSSGADASFSSFVESMDLDVLFANLMAEDERLRRTITAFGSEIAECLAQIRQVDQELTEAGADLQKLSAQNQQLADQVGRLGIQGKTSVKGGEVIRSQENVQPGGATQGSPEPTSVEPSSLQGVLGEQVEEVQGTGQAQPKEVTSVLGGDTKPSESDEGSSSEADPADTPPPVGVATLTTSSNSTTTPGQPQQQGLTTVQKPSSKKTARPPVRGVLGLDSNYDIQKFESKLESGCFYPTDFEEFSSALTVVEAPVGEPSPACYLAKLRLVLALYVMFGSDKPPLKSLNDLTYADLDAFFTNTGKELVINQASNPGPFKPDSKQLEWWKYNSQKTLLLSVMNGVKSKTKLWDRTEAVSQPLNDLFKRMGTPKRLPNIKVTF